MRLPLTFNTQSRDGTLAKDSKVANGFVQEGAVFRRPGTLSAFSGADTGRGMVCWKGTFFTVVGNTLTQGPLTTPVADGTAWTSVATSFGFTFNSAAVEGTLFYDDKILIVAYDTTRAVAVRSSDGGANWTTVTATNLPFASDGGYALVYHLGEIYCVYQRNISANGECWKSTDDGATWTQTSANIGSTNAYLTSLVSDGTKIYAIGGQGASSAYRGVHSSTDGASWSVVGATALPVALSAVGTAYFNSKLWAVAGSFGGTGTDDVYSSSNGGVTWSTEVTAAGFSNRFGKDCVFVFADKLWIVGSNHISNITDAWNSSTGASWTQATANVGHASHFAGLVSISSVPTIVSLQLNNTIFSHTQSIRKATNNVNSGATYTITGDTLPISFTQTSGAATTEYLFIKNNNTAWVLTFGAPGTLTQVTDVDYPAATVPGAVYLDGYIFVMNTEGEIYNSALENPTSWGALDFISAEIEPDTPVALAKHQNYVVAFKDTTTEMFFDAANATGSPLARTQNTAIQIGCGAGYSVANVDGGLFFISKTRSAGLSVHYFAPDSLTPVEVAPPGIQKVLSAADLTTVHCFAGKVGGNTFYVVNLVSAGITLAYSLQSQTWAPWTYLTAQTPKSVSALTQTGGVATATVTGHGYLDGDPVLIAGANQAGYNGTVNIKYVDANTFTYEVDSATVSPATGTITATGYTEGYFPFGYFASCGGFDYVQHETTGEIHKISRDYFNDNGVPINMIVRSSRFDSDSSVNKSMPSMTIVADESDNDLLVRHTDDDYDSYTKFRKVNLGTAKPQLRRNGSFRRRAVEFRCTTANDIRLFAVDIE